MKAKNSKTGAWKTPLKPFDALPERKPPPKKNKSKGPKREMAVVRMGEACRELVEVGLSC